MFAIQFLLTACCLVASIHQTPHQRVTQPHDETLDQEVKIHTEQVAPFQAENSYKIERRAAFDIGSGQIKMQVSDVDLTVNKIVNVLLTDYAIVGLRENVGKSLDRRLSSDIQDKTVDAISGLMKKAAPFHPSSYHGVATEALRVAKNSDVLVERIKNETGLPVSIISQEEEGVLGFVSAVSQAEVDPAVAVSWDFGGGSFQITVNSNDHYSVFQGSLGKVPIRNALLKIQGKGVENTISPNPIFQSEVDLALQLIQENVLGIPDELRQKLHQPDVVVLGIGINPLWGLPQCTHLDRERVFEELQSRLNLDDEAIIVKDSLQKEYAAYRVSNLILFYGVMKALDIHQVRFVGTQGANAVGLLQSPQYWQPSESNQRSHE